MMACVAIVFVVEDKEEMTETLIFVTFYVRAVVAQKSLVV